MIKAIFLDYTGTMVKEEEPYTLELVKRFVMNSNIKDPKVAFGQVWAMIKKIEWECYQDTFARKPEMVNMILDYAVKEWGLSCDLDELRDIWSKSWVHAPLFEDVKPFFERTGLPIYVITNDDYCFVEESMKLKDLAPAGIVSAEAVRACKPHREILDEAVRVAGVKPEEAVMIGDSETSDVACAQEVGVVPILLDRKGKSERTDIRVIRSLDEIDF